MILVVRHGIEVVIVIVECVVSPEHLAVLQGIKVVNVECVLFSDVVVLLIGMKVLNVEYFFPEHQKTYKEIQYQHYLMHPL